MKTNLRNFNISWFATILGSGGVALVSLPFYPQLTLVLTYLLTFVFAILTLIWIAKIIKHRNVVKSEIQHVVLGNFYPLQPISAVILAILYKKLSFGFDLPLLIYGAVLIFCLPCISPITSSQISLLNSITFTAGGLFPQSRLYL